MGDKKIDKKVKLCSKIHIYCYYNKIFKTETKVALRFSNERRSTNSYSFKVRWSTWLFFYITIAQ